MIEKNNSGGMIQNRNDNITIGYLIDDNLKVRESN